MQSPAQRFGNLNKSPLKITNSGISKLGHKLVLNKNYCKSFSNTALQLNCLLGMILFSLFSIDRIIWLKKVWTRVKNMEEEFLYMLVFCITIICIASWVTLISYINDEEGTSFVNVFSNACISLGLFICQFYFRNFCKCA